MADKFDCGFTCYNRKARGQSAFWLTLEKPGRGNCASRIGFSRSFHLSFEKARRITARNREHMFAGHYCTPIYSYPKKNTNASHPRNKERRMREGRKIHNMFVTNYVLPRLRSLGLRCVVGMKTLFSQTRACICIFPSLLLIRIMKEIWAEGRRHSYFCAQFLGETKPRQEKWRSSPGKTGHCDACGFSSRI